jgi:hypothetical protein
MVFLYITQENRWKRKIRMYRDRLREMEQKLQDACSLGMEALTCRDPSIIHSIYLHDRWTQFRIKQLALEGFTRLHLQRNLSMFSLMLKIMRRIYYVICIFLIFFYIIICIGILIPFLGCPTEEFFFFYLWFYPMEGFQ